MYKRQNKDPREIIAKYDTTCAETNKEIKMGEGCIYYPLSKKVYHIESEQAIQFGMYIADLELGYNY